MPVARDSSGFDEVAEQFGIRHGQHRMGLRLVPVHQVAQDFQVVLLLLGKGGLTQERIYRLDRVLQFFVRADGTKREAEHQFKVAVLDVSRAVGGRHQQPSFHAPLSYSSWVIAWRM